MIVRMGARARARCLALGGHVVHLDWKGTLSGMQRRGTYLCDIRLDGGERQILILCSENVKTMAQNPRTR